MFKKFDKDDSGLISKEELSQAVRELNSSVTDAEIEDIISGGCFDENGQLNYENFIKIVTR